MALPQMVEIVELQGQFALLNQHLNSSITNMTSTLQALQADYRSTLKQLDVVVEELHGLREKGNSIHRLSEQLGSFVQASERRWEAQDAKNAAISEAVSSWRGVIRGGTYVGGLILTALLALVVFVYQDDKHRIDSSMDSLEQRMIALHGREAVLSIRPVQKDKP